MEMSAPASTGDPAQDHAPRIEWALATLAANPDIAESAARMSLQSLRRAHHHQRAYLDRLPVDHDQREALHQTALANPVVSLLAGNRAQLWQLQRRAEALEAACILREARHPSLAGPARAVRRQRRIAALLMVFMVVGIVVLALSMISLVP